MLGNFACFFVVCRFFFKLTFFFFKKIFQQYHQSVKQFGSRSGQTFCRAWSGSKLFANVFSRWQKSPLARREWKSFLDDKVRKGMGTLFLEGVMKGLWRVILHRFWYGGRFVTPLSNYRLTHILMMSIWKYTEKTILYLLFPQYLGI